MDSWRPFYLCPRDVICYGSQFALTLLAHQFFLNSCTRTMNPSEADLFYTPYYSLSTPSAINSTYRDQMIHLVTGMSQGEAEKYVEWERVTGTSSKWWKRNSGRDHLIVSNIGGWRWGDYDFLRDVNVFHVTLELPGYLRYKDVTSRVVVVPYPSENPPFVPIRQVTGIPNH
jgi:hypothetical protein